MRHRFLEQHLGLAAGVDEHQRGLVGLDQLVDLVEGMARAVPRPWQPLLGVEHFDDGRRRAAGDDDIGGFALAIALRHQEARQRFRLGDGGRQPDRAQLRRQLPQPRQPERQQIAALGGHQRVQLVEHDTPERAEQKRRVVGRQQQRQLLGRGQQNIRRIAPLPRPPRHRRVAGAGLDLDGEPHLGDRRLQVARDIDRQRFQRRDVEGVEAARALHGASGGNDAALGRAERRAPPRSAGTRPGSCRRRSARSAAPSGHPGLFAANRADARAATSRGRRTSAGIFRAAEGAKGGLVRRISRRQIRPGRPGRSSQKAK